MPEKFPEPNSLDSMEGVPAQDTSLRKETNEKLGQPSISELNPDMWERYKKARMRSKETDPQAFGTNVLAESEQTAEVYWREKLSNPNIRMFAIEDGDAVVAMAGLEKRGERFLLRRVYTVPEAREKGFGKTLIEKICTEAKQSGAKSVELDVAENQESAVNLYGRMGFKEFKREQATKGDGKVHTEIFMRKVFE